MKKKETKGTTCHNIQAFRLKKEEVFNAVKSGEFEKALKKAGFDYVESYPDDYDSTISIPIEDIDFGL